MRRDILDPNTKQPIYYFGKLANLHLKYPTLSYKNVIIKQDYEYQNETLKRFMVVDIDDINKILNEKNYNVYEEITNKHTDIYYKHFIDIDYKVPIGSNVDMDNILNELIQDYILFAKEYFSVNIDESKILISKSSGVSADLYKYSFHLTFPIVYKWEKAKVINDIFNENIYTKYNQKYGYGFIDAGMCRSSQGLRCVYQSKLNDKRINTPYKLNDKFGYSTDSRDYLIGVYSDVNEYSIIDEKIDEIIKTNKNIVKQHHIKFNKLVLDKYKINNEVLLKLDKVSCCLFAIPNTLTNIDINIWNNIVSYVIGYALSVHNAILKVNNSNEYSIHPKKILEFYIRQLLEWTKQAYKSEMVVMGKESYKIYKSYDVVSLKKMCKEKGIKNYSKCNKEQLITLLNVIEKKVEIKDESEAQHLKSIKKIVDYYVKNADKYPWFFKCCFSKLKTIANSYNKEIFEKWVIANELPSSIYLDHQPFFEYHPYPEYGDVEDIVKKSNLNRITYMDAKCGLGKTEMIISIVKANPEASILIITPRISLATTLEPRYNKILFRYDECFYCYINNGVINKKYFDDEKYNNRFICSVESLHRIPKNKTYDIIILDEVDALSDTLVSDTCKSRGLYVDIYNTYERLTKTANKIICAEAIASVSSVALLKNLLIGDEKITALITDAIRFKQEVHLKAYKKALIPSDDVKDVFNIDLIENLENGEKVCGFVSSKNRLIHIVSHIQSYNNTNKKNFKILAIHADNKNEMSKYIRNPSLITKDGFDCFFYTSTIAFGFSEEQQDYWSLKMVYYNTFGDATDRCVSANTVIQAMYRCRYLTTDPQISHLYIDDQINTRNNLLTNEIHIENNVNNRIFNFESIENDLYSKSALTRNKEATSYIETINKCELGVMNNQLKKESFADEGEDFYRYINIDTKEDVLFVSKYHFHKFSSFGLLFSDESNAKIKRLLYSVERKNAYSKKNICSVLEALFHKQKAIWINDIENNPKVRKTKQLMPLIEESEVSKKMEEYAKTFDMNTITDDIDDNILIFKHYGMILQNTELILKLIDNKSYFSIISSVNKYNDPLYNTEEKQNIEVGYSLLRYFDGEKYLEPFNYNDKKHSEIIKRLITYYHRENHYQNTEYNMKQEILKNIIDFFHSSEILKVNEIKADFTRITITTEQLDPFEDKITDLFNKYCSIYTLKKSRFSEKTISKLNFLFEEIFGFNIDISNGSKIQKRIDGKKVALGYEYKLNITPKSNSKNAQSDSYIEEMILRKLFRHFYFSGRVEYIETLELYKYFQNIVEEKTKIFNKLERDTKNIEFDINRIEGILDHIKKLQYLNSFEYYQDSQKYLNSNTYKWKFGIYLDKLNEKYKKVKTNKILEDEYKNSIHFQNDIVSYYYETVDE